MKRELRVFVKHPSIGDKPFEFWLLRHVDRDRAYERATNEAISFDSIKKSKIKPIISVKYVTENNNN